MTPYYEDDMVTLWHGDCRQVMSELGEASVDAIVTDPPYELAFMGKGWDASGIAYDRRVWENAWHVLKPGGHLLAFGGTRTWHRLAAAIEDAGFEIRDSIAWMYASGFPKSLDVSKAIDKQRLEDLQPAANVAQWLVVQLEARCLTRRDVTEHFGAANIAQQWTTHWIDGAVKPRVPRWEQWLELKSWLNLSDEMDAEVWRLNGRKGQPGEAWAKREVVGTKSVNGEHGTAGGYANGIASHNFDIAVTREIDITAPATPAAQQWQGWGTALKPAFEPIVVARKPLIGTVAENVLRYGTGALNIDGCRVSGQHTYTPRLTHNSRLNDDDWDKIGQHAESVTSSGRWPANVILDESQAAELDKQSGVTSSPTGEITQGGDHFSIGSDKRTRGTKFQGHGDIGGASRFFYTAKANSSERPRVDGLAHPTVKPLDLMRYLVRLVTPPGGTVLEPFAGSGTTLEACVMEGFHAIGIELTDEYLPLIRQRLSKPIEQVLL